MKKLIVCASASAVLAGVCAAAVTAVSDPVILNTGARAVAAAATKPATSVYRRYDSTGTVLVDGSKSAGFVFILK